MKDKIFDVKAMLGAISKNPNGWIKELNRVAWHGGEAKYDIREWDPDHERMTRGITLTDKEMETLCMQFLHWKKSGSGHSLEAIAKGSPRESIGKDIIVDIYRTICNISMSGEGWSRDLKVVRWNGGAVKYDIRSWSPDGSRMTRGLSFTEEEMQKICDLYCEREKDRAYKEIFDEAV